jgi:hypothetical protein
LAHLWFVTIHPFDDGNGRIARAIGDLALARSERSTQKGALDITRLPDCGCDRVFPPLRSPSSARDWPPGIDMLVSETIRSIALTPQHHRYDSLDSFP